MNEQKPVRPRGTDRARVIQVIETHSLKGLGASEDPVRVLTQYWDFDGNLLAESDDVRQVDSSCCPPLR
jgi:hypothetical protein